LRGELVEQAIIVRIWEEIRLEIASKYPVDNVEMPNIKALVLKHKNFREALRKLHLLYLIEDYRLSSGRALQSKSSPPSWAFEWPHGDDTSVFKGTTPL